MTKPSAAVLFWGIVTLINEGSGPNGHLVVAFSCPTNLALRKSFSTIPARPLGSRCFSSTLHAGPQAENFFFSEDDDEDVASTAAELEPKTDTRMVNGSWNNKNQFPSHNFPQPSPELEPEVDFGTAVATAPPELEPAASVDDSIPSFLSVDGNGTGGLMQRAKGTGGANPTLMVPSDVNPNMRMVTPIDSGKETQKIQNTNPSTVASYAALSALTRTDQSTKKKPSDSSNQQSTSSTDPHTHMVPFEGSKLVNTETSNSFHPSSHSIKVKRFRGEKSIMNDHREGFSKPVKQQLSEPLDSHHHVNVDATGTNGVAANQKRNDKRQLQHPQQNAYLPSTRLVPFTGSSLMETVSRPAEENSRSSTSKRLVKFDGQSMMEEQRYLKQANDLQAQTNLLRQGNHRLVPYQKVPSESPSSDVPKDDSVGSSGSNKMVLYNKQAVVASSVAKSAKRDYYYIQYRPPTDSTMARKTGLQVNTPISLWNERDTFLDSA